MATTTDDLLTLNTPPDSAANSGTRNTALVKFNSSGVFQWAKQWGGNSFTDTLSNIVIDNSNHIFLTYNTSSNSVANLSEYDTNGNVLLHKTWTINGTYTTFARVALDSTGNIYLQGITSSDMVAGSGYGTAYGTGAFGLAQDSFLIKLDSSGNQLWVNQWGTPGSNYDTASGGLTVDKFGNIYLTGVTEGNLSTTTASTPGSHKIAGSGPAVGVVDAFLIKVAPDGSQTWVLEMGIASYQTWPTGVATDSSGNIFLSGYSEGNLISGSGAGIGLQDGYVFKISPNKLILWTNRLGVPSNKVAGGSVVVDSYDGVFMSGTTYGNLLTGSGPAIGGGGGNTFDAFLVHYNADGSQQ